MTIYFKKNAAFLFLVLIVAFVTVSLYLGSSIKNASSSFYVRIGGQSRQEKVRGQLYQIDQEWFLSNCLKVNNRRELSLEYLPQYIRDFESSSIGSCNQIGAIFRTMFELDESFGEIKVTEQFKVKVQNWLNNDPALTKQALKQKIIKVYNRYLYEEVIYNPLRGKRPQAKPLSSPKTYSLDLLKESMKGCDFCEGAYETNTAADVFDRIETKHSYTAANTFKYDKWHAIIASRNHNTLYLSEEELVDMFMISLDWFRKVNEVDSTAIYPQLIWDAMPKSGASQVHTHLQTSMGINAYYGGLRRVLEAAALYHAQNERYYFDDFILLHRALGLAKKINNTYLIINMIPLKEQEVMLICDNDAESYATLTRVLNDVIRIFIDKLDQYSFSMSMFYPEYHGGDGFFPLKSKSSFTRSLPSEKKLDFIYSRLLFRAPVANMRSDYNGLDLYTSSVLGIDRYTIANALFNELDKLY